MAALGYDDTPVLSHCPYRVHDSQRPQPRVVQPGSSSSQDRPGDPPADAVVLFGGADLSGWQAFKGGEPGWKVEDGYMEVVPKSGDLVTTAEFGDCQLHLEWAAPVEVVGDSQGRGNSGVFLMARYEIQVLDCFDNPTYADGTTAALYGQYPPLVNACRPPGMWQTYDIIWEAPRFEGDRLVRPAYATVIHNGIVVHHHAELLGGTGHRKLPEWEPHPPVGPLRLQDHGNPVRFRNIWYRPLKGYDEQ